MAENMRHRLFAQKEANYMGRLMVDDFIDDCLDDLKYNGHLTAHYKMMVYIAYDGLKDEHKSTFFILPLIDYLKQKLKNHPRLLKEFSEVFEEINKEVIQKLENDLVSENYENFTNKTVYKKPNSKKTKVGTKISFEEFEELFINRVVGGGEGFFND